MTLPSSLEPPQPSTSASPPSLLCFFSTNPLDLAPTTTIHLPFHHLHPQLLLPSMTSWNSSVVAVTDSSSPLFLDLTTASSLQIPPHCSIPFRAPPLSLSLFSPFSSVLRRSVIRFLAPVSSPTTFSEPGVDPPPFPCCAVHRRRLSSLPSFRRRPPPVPATTASTVACFLHTRGKSLPVIC